MGHQVLGLGIAGWSAARLLRAQGKEVWVWDEQDSELLRQRQAELEREGIPVLCKVCLGSTVPATCKAL
ncbi:MULTISPECIES: hypothetical protein [unclassified Synechococcus]|uniref:hypothetical protein n=1 Tax=unclassified Synechococcus TaxID=2626047 RepID=UPI0039C0565E